MRVGGIGAVTVLMACGARAPEQVAADSSSTVRTQPADTLVLVTRSGHRIWLAEGRDAHDSAGASCYERSVEIRTDSTSVKVPLLFVANPPRELGAGTIRAELSKNCRVMAIYQVELTTGRPTKLEDR